MAVMYKLCLNLLDTVSAGIWRSRPMLVCKHSPRPFVKTVGCRPSVHCYMTVSKCLDSNRVRLYPRSTCREGTDTSCRPNTRPTSMYNYLSDDPDNEETLAVKDYSSFLEEKENRKRVSKQILQDSLKCTDKELGAILKKYRNLALITPECLSERIQNFCDIGLKKEVLKDNPWLLGCKSSDISYKMMLIQKMRLYDINVAVSLLNIPLNRLQQLSILADSEAHIVPGGSRIKYLHKALKCQLPEVCKAVAEHTFLQTLPIEHIKKVLDLLLEYGVSPQDIFKDVWVFRYNTLIVEERLKLAHDADIQRIKPWVVRCKVDVLSNTLRRRAESLSTLGPHSSVLEYLAQRLDCSLENVITLSRRYPPLLRVNVTKLKEVLDYIYSEGFSPQQVYQVPRILCHSLETTQERLNQIRDLRHNPSSLIVLCKSKRDYVDYLNRLKSQQKHAFPT